MEIQGREDEFGFAPVEFKVVVEAGNWQHRSVFQDDAFILKKGK